MHCAKSVHIRSYSGPHFSRIFPHSEWIRRETKYLSVFSPNAGKCGKNADQNNSEYGHFIHSVDHNPSNMFHKWAALSQISVNPIQGGHIQGCSRMRGGGGKKVYLPIIYHTYPAMMNLAELYFTQRRTKKYMNQVTHHFSSADISIFSPKITKFCCIKKRRYRLSFDT